MTADEHRHLEEEDVEPPVSGPALSPTPASPRFNLAAVLPSAMAGVLVGGLVVGLATRRSHATPPAVHAEPAAAAAPAGGGGAARIDAALFERLGVQFAPVTRAARGGTIDVVGTLDFDREHLAEVSSHAAGRAVRVEVALGQRVTRGQVLARLESPAIGEAAAQYRVHESELRTARQHLARQRELMADSLTTRREFELAEAHVRAAEASMAAAMTRLRALGISPQAVDPRTGHAPMVAPIDGVVVRREVVLGGWVEPQVEAFAVADLSRFWVELDVFENDLGGVAVGDAVSVDVPSLGLRDLRGAVTFVHAEVNRATRMGRVRVEVPNTDGRLRAGVSVAAHIQPRGGTGALRVPAEAVRVREGGPHVLVRRGETAQWTRVETGARRGGDIEIVSGLSEGDVVAVTGLGLIAGVP